MPLGAPGVDEHVRDPAGEREVCERVAVEVAELAPTEPELDAAEAVRLDGDAVPAPDLALDPLPDVRAADRRGPPVASAAVDLVVDWDGTVTVRDSQWMLLERFGDRNLFAATEQALGRTLSYREVMEAQLATVRVPLDEAVAFLVEGVEVRAGFAALVERFAPLLLSSGFVETIEPILAREGVRAELIANRLDPRPDGWRILWADDAPCPVCGDLCKRRALPTGRPLVYVGDGYSDRCAALAADRVFATRALAEYLAAEGVPFEPFETFDDVAAALS